MFDKIKKRDGRIVEFDSSKITSAIVKAGKATGEFGEREARKLTLRVLTLSFGPVVRPSQMSMVFTPLLKSSATATTGCASNPSCI